MDLIEETFTATVGDDTDLNAGSVCEADPTHPRKKFSVRKWTHLPPLLIFRLQRLSVGAVASKKTLQQLESSSDFNVDRLDVQEDLDVREWVHRRLPSEEDEDSILNTAGMRTRYQLSAIIQYRNAHYVSYIKVEDPQSKKLRWAIFNDLEQSVRWESPFEVETTGTVEVVRKTRGEAAGAMQVGMGQSDDTGNGSDSQEAVDPDSGEEETEDEEYTDSDDLSDLDPYDDDPDDSGSILEGPEVDTLLANPETASNLGGLGGEGGNKGDDEGTERAAAPPSPRTSALNVILNTLGESIRMLENGQGCDLDSLRTLPNEVVNLVNMLKHTVKDPDTVMTTSDTVGAESSERQQRDDRSQSGLLDAARSLEEINSQRAEAQMQLDEINRSVARRQQMLKGLQHPLTVMREMMKYIPLRDALQIQQELAAAIPNYTRREDGEALRQQRKELQTSHRTQAEELERQRAELERANEAFFTQREQQNITRPSSPRLPNPSLPDPRLPPRQPPAAQPSTQARGGSGGGGSARETARPSIARDATVSSAARNAARDNAAGAGGVGSGDTRGGGPGLARGAGGSAGRGAGRGTPWGPKYHPYPPGGNPRKPDKSTK